MDELINRLRFFYFISGVLVNQQTDPVCCKCKAFVNSVNRIKEGLTELERLPDKPDIPDDVVILLEEARGRLEQISPASDATGQKKAGNCKMPEGVCFVKLSKSVLSRLQEHRPG